MYEFSGLRFEACSALSSHRDPVFVEDMLGGTRDRTEMMDEKSKLMSAYTLRLSRSKLSPDSHIV